jgi:uncharacterized protein
MIHWITPPPIRFRDIALLLVGSIVGGSFVGALIGIPLYGFMQSKFVLAFVLGTSFYGSFLLGYRWKSEEQGWIAFRTRFSPVGTKPLILGVSTAVTLLVFISMLHWILLWAGIKLAHVPPPLQGWAQLPLAFVLIVVLGPLAEELLFRGLLLDWLKRKMSVWAAAVILSVIFSLLHANPFSLGAVGWLAFGARFLLGFAASALTIKYRSLRPAFVMHATWNAIGCVASVLSDTGAIAS